MKKDNYGQVERSFDMTEHPDQCADEQFNELLRDDESRQTYQLISDTTSACEYRQTSDKLADEIIEEGWHKLMEKKSTSKLVCRYHRQVAAVVIGILTVSGIAVTAVSIVKGSKKRLATDLEVVITNNMAHTKTLQEKGSTCMTVTYSKLKKKKVGEIFPPKQFDNITLQDIVQEMSGYYGIKTVCRNPEVGQPRLRFLWNRDQSVEHTVETLNIFEKVQLILTDSTITTG